MTSTYFLVTTVDTDNPEDAIALARDMDEPTEVSTVDQLAQRIRGVVSDLVHDPETRGSENAQDDVLDWVTAKLIEIVTLGNVPAGEVTAPHIGAERQRNHARLIAVPIENLEQALAFLHASMTDDECTPADVAEYPEDRW